MDFDIHALTGLTVVLGGFGVVATSYLGAYLLGKQAGRREAEQARALAGDDAAPASLARIETAVEAVALEVERLSEGQRWLLRAGTSRPEQPVAKPRTPVPQHRTPA